MYLKNYTPDVAAVLATIANRVRDLHAPVNLYLDHIGRHEVPTGLWERLGIRQILSNTYQDSIGSKGYWTVANSKTGNTADRWNSLKNDAIIEGLRALMSDCSVIRFADWTKTNDAAGFWYGLFSDVIKPLNKRDFEFIFHPGDVSKKLVFEVDELLDIMGDYSSYGRVTLVLDEQEAGQLWGRLNGRASYATSSGFRSPGVKEKYLFLFNTMRIDVLLITGDNRTMIISRDGQFEVAGRSFNKINIPGDTKDYFNAGYQLGLLLHLEIPHCVALGLAVSGAYVEQASRPGSKELFSYINDWMAEWQLKGVLKNDFNTQAL